MQKMWEELEIKLLSKGTLKVITVTITPLSVAALSYLNHEELVRVN